jgi:hypothetical protein
VGILVAVVVSVLLDGRLIDSAQPAVLAHGVVVAPVDPYLRAIAERIEDNSAHGGAICFVRGVHHVCVTPGTRSARVDGNVQMLPIAPYRREGRLMIPLAAITRALGESVAYDASYQSVSIVSPVAPPVATMAPYAPPSWRPSPGPTFALPVPATPQPTVSGIPQPRRTPIVVPT